MVSSTSGSATQQAAMFLTSSRKRRQTNDIPQLSSVTIGAVAVWLRVNSNLCVSVCSSNVCEYTVNTYDATTQQWIEKRMPNTFALMQWIIQNHVQSVRPSNTTGSTPAQSSTQMFRQTLGSKHNCWSCWWSAAGGTRSSMTSNAIDDGNVQSNADVGYWCTFV
jgi:hypothetical protein